MKRHTAWSNGTVAVTVPQNLAPAKFFPEPRMVNQVLVSEYAKFQATVANGGTATFHIFGDSLAEMRGKNIIADLVLLKEKCEDRSERVLLNLMEPKEAFRFRKASHQLKVMLKKDASFCGGYRYFDSGNVWVAVGPAPAYKAQINKLLTATEKRHAVAATTAGDSQVSRGDWRVIDARGRVIMSAELAHA